MNKTQNENDLIELAIQQSDKLEEFDQVVNVDTQAEMDIAEELAVLDDGITQAVERIKAEREKIKTIALDNLRAFNRSFLKDVGVVTI